MFNLWLTGYATNGNSSDDSHVGLYDASTLKEAVKMNYDESSDINKKFFNLDSLTFWGCSFYDGDNAG